MPKFTVPIFGTILCLLFFSSTNIWAQQRVPPIAQGLENINDVKEFNITDKQKRKQGYWIINQDAKRNEPAITSIGKYIDNKKTGLWYNINKEGKPISILRYKKGVLDGTSQYFTDGKLSCEGQWRGLNPDNKMDSVEVYDPRTDETSIVMVPSERGSLMHGIWKYYNPENGMLVKEEEYQVSNLIRKKEIEPHSHLDAQTKQKQDDAFLKNTPKKKHKRSSQPKSKI